MSFKAQTEGGLVVTSQAMPQINLTQMNMINTPDMAMQESFMGAMPPMVMQSMMAPQDN
jgi:hypothetical protein